MEKWNDILYKYLRGELKDGAATLLQNPNPLLMKIGLINTPVRITYKVLDKKFKKHGDLQPKHLIDLDKKIQKPLMAFKYQGSEKYNNKKGVNLLLNITSNKNFLLVGIHFNNNKGTYTVNDIRTIFFKEYQKTLNWIKQDELLYADIKQLQKIAGHTSPASEILQNIKNKYNINRKSKLFVLQNTLQGILNTNTMRPTYQILPDYSHLIQGYQGKTEFIKKGTVSDVLTEIKNIIRKHHKQVAPLAKHLQADTDIQTAYNIWHWSITNIKYKLDRLGTEELRTPARSWADRTHGIDCDDFTILTASILMNLGYSPQLVVVAYNGSPSYAHIFTGLYLSVINGKPAGGIIIDPVDKKFNHVIPEITKTKIELMNNIEVLSGIETPTQPLIAGLGFFQEYTPEEKKLITTKAVNSEKYKRKIQFLLAHKSTLVEEPLKLMMPYIYDILPDGTVIWNSKEIAKYGEQFLGEVNTLTENMLSGIDADFNQEEVMALTGFDCLMPDNLGRRGWFKKALNKFKSKVKKSWSKVKTSIKKAASAVKNAAKSAVKGAKKLLLAAPRNAFLLLIRINAFGLATKFYMGYSSYATLKKYGIDAETHRKIVEVTKKAETFFVKAGGNASAFKKAVFKGKKHHPKLNKTMTKAWKAGLRGLGEPATVAATAATATPFLTKVALWFKKINFKKVFGALKTAKEFIPQKDKTKKQESGNNATATAEDYQMPDEKDLPNVRTISPLNNDDKDSGGNENKNNWLLPVGIAAGILALMMIK